MDDLIWCNNSYSPNSEQYLTALGSFGSSIIIIGGLVTLALFVLFFEQVVYTNQTAHSSCKRHIYWITSVFPMMTLMSLLALLIPRAYNVCLSVKMVYMSIGISHFTDLTKVMFGGEELLLERGHEDTFNLRLTPLCCCCKCLPRPPVTKYSLRLVVLLTDQLPFIQAVYYVMVLILLAADNITLGDVNPAGAFLWLNLVKLASVMFGVYGFMILSNFSRGYLDDFQYGKKSRSIRLLVLVTNFQLLIFNIMGNYNAFPCIPPFVSPAVYKQTVDNSLYILEMMILGPYTFWQYHDLEFAAPIAHLPLHSSRSSSISHSSRSSSNSSQDEGSKTSTTSTVVTEHSNGASSDPRDASSNTNNKDGNNDHANDLNMKGNEPVNGDCEKGDCIMTTQVTGILDSALNTNNGGDSSIYKVPSHGEGLLASSGSMRGNKTQTTGILGSGNNGLKGNRESNRSIGNRSRFFAGIDSNTEEWTRDSSFASRDSAKGGKASNRRHTRKEKTSIVINVDGSDDKASASNRNKSSSRKSRSRDGSSDKSANNDKKKSKNTSKKSKSDKNSSRHKNKKMASNFYDVNEIFETATNIDKDKKSSYNMTTFIVTTDKSHNESAFNNHTRKTISSLALYPGMLNRAISVSQPNIKQINEYERF